MPFYRFFLGEGSPTKLDCRKKGTLILTFLLEDLVVLANPPEVFVNGAIAQEGGGFGGRASGVGGAGA